MTLAAFDMSLHCGSVRPKVLIVRTCVETGGNVKVLIQGLLIRFVLFCIKTTFMSFCVFWNVHASIQCHYD